MFLLIDNYDSFTYNLVQAFQVLGYKPLVIRNDDENLPELAVHPDLRMVCISPGPGHPADAGKCLEFLSRLPKQVPVLGVCLGHQILGAFAGADVTIGERVMHGKVSDVAHTGRGLFAGLPRLMRVGRYHSLFVHAEDVPDRLEVTARSVDCDEVMALRYLDRPWVGVQFHPESVLTPEGLVLLANFPEQVVAEYESGGAMPATSDADEVIAEEEQRSVFSIPAVLGKLSSGNDLTEEQAEGAFAALMDGEMTSAQAGALLAALRLKGETPLELAAAARAVVARAKTVSPLEAPVLDIVGTGGDGRSSFNCSTLSALTLAGMGYRVVKHGNRAVSGTSGSADIIEGVGLPLQTDPEDIQEQLALRNFVFLYAPHYHPAFKNVGGVRRELGIPTLFNLLGPLVNPARPTHTLVGVGDPRRLETVAHALALGGVQRAYVVHGAGHYDELTPLGPARVIPVVDGKVLDEIALDPMALGFTAPTPQELAVHSREEAIEVAQAILEGKGPEAMRRMTALNVAMALHLLCPDEPLEQCAARAREAVAEGAGRKVLYARKV